MGVCHPVLQILTPFQNKCNFPHPFSDHTSKIHTHSQTRPLGRNYVIITYIRLQTKKFFKCISNSHFYSFGIETITTFIRPRSSLENHTRLQTKMGKVCTRFQTKNHTLWGAYTHMAYIREYPSPVSVNLKKCEDKTT